MADRRLLETCFDPAIAILEAAILDVLAKMPAIKVRLPISRSSSLSLPLV